MRSVMQGERPEFTGDPFNNQRGEMTASGDGVTSDRLHRPVGVASMKRVDQGGNQRVALSPNPSRLAPKTSPGEAVGGLFIVFLGSHWQQIEFRSSPGVPVGSETSFGVMISEQGRRPALRGVKFCC